MRIATVVNIARALEELAAAKVWTIGLAAEASDVYADVDRTLPTALVLGAEDPDCDGWYATAAIDW